MFNVLNVKLTIAGTGGNPETGRLDLCLTVEEEDGSPSSQGCGNLEVTNGSLTDDGDGNFSLSTGAGGSNHNLLSATHSDTTAASVTRGALIRGDSTPAWVSFPVGGINSVLTANGSDPAYSSSPTVISLNATSTATGMVLSATSALQVGSDYISDITGSGLSVTAGGALTATGGSGDITDVNEGLAIDVTNPTGPDPTVAFDPTELTGSRTWGDASTDTITWTWNRATGTDPTLTFGSATVTGQILSVPTALQVGSDYINDLTGPGLAVTAGGALTATSGSGDITSVGDVASGAAFDGTQGTVLTFNNAGGDATLTYNGSQLTASTNVTSTGSFSASATVTGSVLSTSTALQVGTDYISTITGAGLNNLGGALNSDGMILFSGSTTSFTANFYCIPGGDCSTGSGSDDAWTFPMSGNISKLYFFLKTAPGVGNSWDCAPVINNTASTNLTISTGNASGEFSDTSGTDAIAEGDEFGFQCLETGTATATAQIGFSIVFTPN